MTTPTPTTYDANIGPGAGPGALIAFLIISTILIAAATVSAWHAWRASRRHPAEEAAIRKAKHWARKQAPR